MTVVIGAVIESDLQALRARAVITDDGLYELVDFDELLLPPEVAERVVGWVRCGSKCPNAGSMVSDGADKVTLQGVDGMMVNRDSAVGVLRLIESAALESEARCRVTVTFRGHEPRPYSAAPEAAAAFAKGVADHVDVRIEGLALPTDPALPCEELWLP